MNLRTKLLAHLEMMRPYTMFHAGMLGFASALFLSGGEASWWRVALCFIVPTLGWIAGLYAGDYYDRDLDAIAKPHRPVPSGRVSPREAFSFMVFYILLGYALALVLSPVSFAIAVVTTVSGIAYSKTFKKMAILGNFDRGLLAALTVLFSGAAVGALSGTGWGVAALLGLFFFHDSSSNLVGAIRDLEGDRRAGYRTVPVVYGVAGSVWISAALALVWLVIALLLFSYYHHSSVALGLFAVSFCIACAVFVLLLLNRHRLTRPQALAAHKAMVIERVILSGAIAAVHGPAPVVIGVLVFVIAATELSQIALRNRYEFGTTKGG
ncbi:MAG: UbiA family prenyltransferase [Rubrobacteraceae bacterium]|uniref:UbiA family prenyltransferase n=1 Tax=Rubrobacter naiadicus TaxID=1392641 RepID=UPI002361F79F|nr:UbiA family prenyltransferase [Rubrobacter naiadicus]MBX6765010.1 UbiA family prenyltransferase [Rubrobacteraceae bacterium]MCL6438983.1 UbiA family prenyltransferase [Rubrobacteraceae bacterium]